ncbi:cryptochrome/photolyase family protein [Comamonas composti]|uniref:cryptochrome/photolyase family protein n=1 Tax=Comamonas composti TaxID=408558 RepID=UPI00041EAB03|nr:deoxyribodipyrimidine photo-lyase [Comamonas composti]
MPGSYAVGLVWLRRDLRLADHAALHHALRQCRQVHLVFVLDETILADLPKSDRRVAFICQSLWALDQQLRDLGGNARHGLIVRHGRPQEQIPALAQELGAQAVFCNWDDEPSALARDAQVRQALLAQSVALQDFKDHMVFARHEVLTQARAPFSVFTPYKNAWLRKITPFYLKAYPSERDLPQALAPRPPGDCRPMPSAQDLGFDAHSPMAGGSHVARDLLAGFAPRLADYDKTRDFPALQGTSRLSVHLRFGTLSIRSAAALAWEQGRHCEGAATWLSELIWRDFYLQILAHHPHVEQACFKPAYEAIVWNSGPQADAWFEAWCQGRTGYPLVDAAMRELLTTGFMHNRLRMLTASFLTKDLGIDWRRGQAWFAQQLNDYDLAANNGGWQWAASTGCDAQPWFRIFNPVTQSRKFDPDASFIARHVPELAPLAAPLRHAPWLARPLELVEAGLHLGRDYPWPLVDHANAREQTLARYAVVKGLQENS